MDDAPKEPGKADDQPAKGSGRPPRKANTKQPRKRSGSAPAAPLREAELRSASFCKGFEPDLVATLARECAREHYAPNSQIIGHDSPGKDVFLLLAGRARVAVVSRGGRDVTYDVIKPGETIGELAAIDGKKRSASVLAMDDVFLVRIPHATFTACMRSHSSFAFAVARRLARTARWMSERVQEFQGYAALGRVCAELLRLCGGVANKPFSITALDLASRVGARADHVQSILKELKRKSLIRRTKDGYEVLDIAGLQAAMKDSVLE